MNRPCSLSKRRSSTIPQLAAVEIDRLLQVGDANHRVQVLHPSSFLHSRATSQSPPSRSGSLRSQMRIREVVHRVIDSPITQVGRWKEAAAPELPLIDVSQAAPTYPPAQELRDHIASQAQSPATATYTDQQGILPLRAGLARSLTVDYDAPVAVENVAVTAGCNQAFCLAMMALTEPGRRGHHAAPHLLQPRHVAAVPGHDTRLSRARPGHDAPPGRRRRRGDPLAPARSSS